MVASWNPYHRDNGSRLVIRYVVATLDILGFAEMVREARCTAIENEFLTRL
jgi:hypothetical protein